MNLYLFGGAEIDQPSRSITLLKNLIKEVFLALKPKSIFQIPFARPNPTENEWKEGWLQEMMKNTGIKILDSRIDSEIDQASNSAIFINGGIERRNLIKKVKGNKKLFELIINSQNIIAESAGSMAMGEFLRADRNGTEIIQGFGILKNTIIEPHYSEKHRQQLLIDDLKKSKMKYGIGIDSATGIITTSEDFPNKWKKIGAGNVFILRNGTIEQ
jgi:cyanophycinase-like exopeptidase